MYKLVYSTKTRFYLWNGSRIADLVANVQKMHNDIDKANETDRRRLETQIHTLEAQAWVLLIYLAYFGEMTFIVWMLFQSGSPNPIVPRA